MNDNLLQFFMLIYDNESHKKGVANILDKHRYNGKYLVLIQNIHGIVIFIS